MRTFYLFVSLILLAPFSLSAQSTITQSSAYPYGIKFQLFENSPSVNSNPWHSGYLMSPVDNTGAVNQHEIPTVATADQFANKIYFDSQAAAGGDGSQSSPYNNLELVMKEDYPNNTAILLKAGSLFTMSNLRASDQKSNIYFGSYGEGQMPIVSCVNNLDNPTESTQTSAFYGQNITVDGIHITGSTSENYGRLIHTGGTNLTIANCHLESIYWPGVGFLFNIFKGGAENMVLYHNEIAFSRDDIWYGSSKYSYKIVSNYFHHSNMGIFDTDNYDPANRETWKAYGGDIIQFEYPGLNGAYIANNYFDKGTSAGKFALIFNGGNENSNIVVEYNTFVGPMKAFGGAALQWHTPGILRHNLIMNTDQEGLVSGLASFKGFASEIADNHFVGYTEANATWNLSFSDLAEGNVTYENLEAYKAALAPEARYGSDIFYNASESSGEDYALYQNFPNPFMEATTIPYFLPEAGEVTIKIYDMLGNLVKSIELGAISAGKKSYDWDATGLAYGVYVYQLEAGGFTDSKKCVIEP